MATRCGGAADSTTVYTLTPELAFSPSVARAQVRYRIGDVLLSTETRHMEFKLGSYAISNLESLIRKYGSAFLNSGGGTLAVGVADNGTIVGIYASSIKQDRLRQTIKEEFRAFKPSVTSDLYEIDFVPTNDEDKFVLEIHVRAGADDEIYVDREDKMYLRRDGSVQGPLWPRSIKAIVIEKLTKALNKSENTGNQESLVSLASATPVLNHINPK